MAGPALTANAGAGGNSLASQFVTEVEKFLGYPYVYGDEGPSAFDCSGLVQYALAQLGISAPRTSEEQWAWVDQIPQSALQPGDLVFAQFPGDNTSPGHVGIYTGNGQVLSAEDPSAGVGYSSLASWAGNIVGYGEVPGLDYSGTVAPAASSSSGTAATGLPSGGFLSNLLNSIATGFADLIPGGTTIAADTAAFGGLGAIADAIGAFAAPFVHIAEKLDWLFVPSHWVRILCGVSGGVLVLGGVWGMTHVGAHVGGGATVYGVSIPTPSVNLPVSILMTGAGGVLLFIAFHNLPSTIETFPQLVGWIAGNVTSPGTTAGGSPSGSS